MEKERKNDRAWLLMDRQRHGVVEAAGDFAALFGLKCEQVKEDPSQVFAVVSGENGESFAALLGDWNGTVPVSFSVSWNDGERWGEVSLCPLAERDEVFVLFREITDERKLMADMDRKLLLAQEESLAKSAYLSDMSHEIRTPMNGILGLLKLAEGLIPEGGPLDTYMKKIRRLSVHLMSLVNDILDISRIESGRETLENGPVDLYAFGRRLRDMFWESTRQKGIALTVEWLDFDCGSVLGDELRLSQIMMNLLSNAVKFTSAGEIRVTLRQLHREGGSVDLMFRVQDTGIGMDPEMIRRIFRPFEQADDHTRSTFGGTGLGMTITDRIVRLMGGEITVESAPGQGSAFSVYLNLLEAPEEGRKEPARGNFSFAGKRVLLAEDNRINGEVAVSLLQDLGAEADWAKDGREALELFEKSPLFFYDVVLLDVRMPRMGGREAARAIRGLTREDAKGTLIFALSADAFPEDRRLSTESRMDGHFAKPVDFEGMQEEIGRMLSEGKDDGERHVESFSA